MKIKVYERMRDTRLIEIVILITIINNLCVSIWMVHMFFKLMFRTGTALFIEVGNRP